MKDKDQKKTHRRQQLEETFMQKEKYKIFMIADTLKLEQITIKKYRNRSFGHQKI